MKNLILNCFIVFSVLSHTNINAQTEGQLQLTVYGEGYDSLVRAPFATSVVTNGDTTFHARAGVDGIINFYCLKAGIYKVQARHILYGDTSVDSIQIYKDSITTESIYLKDKIEIFYCGPLYYHEPHTFIPDFKEISLSRFDQVSNGLGLKNENSFNQSVTKSQIDENVVFMIDGIRYENIDHLPLYRVHSVKQFINGLPARYGDTTSEVYTIRTKTYFDYYYEWKARQ